MAAEAAAISNVYCWSSMLTMPARTRASWLLVVALLLATSLPSACVTAGPPPDRPEPQSVTPQPGGAQSVVALSELPREAQETLRLIMRGGPYPYQRDGIVFGNREGLLPSKPSGYYHEYTVPTPGGTNRGTRRIISGREGEYYYTGDHYRTFQRIKESR